ncbi:MAG: alpha/beta hydrolase [Pseudomonadota bacterium]
MTGFIDIPGNEPPAGASVETIAGPDGAPLRAAFFPIDQARGTVLLLTGWSEFIEKYIETVHDLQARGFNVAMMDWRGQGLSDRQAVRECKWQGYFRILSDDLAHFFENHVKPRFDGPYILMTHSMGGMPALMLLSTGYEGFSRAVLSAPLTKLFPDPQDAILRAVANAASNLGLARSETARGRDHADVFEGNIFTSDKRRHAMFRDLKLAEPKAASASPTYGWVNAAFKASKAIHAPGALTGIKVPVLIISAGGEKQIDGADHHTIADASDMVSCTLIPGALHEIMMERDSIRDQFFKAFDDFVAPVFAAPSPAA